MAPFAQKRVLAHLKPDEPRPEPKGPGGRPTEYKPEYCQMAEEHMAQGFSLTAFAGKVKLGRETVYGWLSAHREFSDAIARGRSARTFAWEQRLMEAKSGGQATTVMFALKNVEPTEWRDLKHVESTHLHAIAQLTDAQLMAIAQGLQPGSVEMIEGSCERVDHGDKHG